MRRTSESRSVCLTLCDPVDYTGHGILQVRILEWVSFPFSRASSQPRDWTQVFHITGGFSTSWATREAREVSKTPFKLVRWVLSCSLLMSVSEAFSVTFTLNKIYTKLWVTETVFGPQVKSPPQRQVWQHCSPFTPKLSYLWLIHVNVWQKPAQLVKNPPSIQETWVQSLDWEDSLEKGTATRSGILTWRIPWTVLVHGVTKRRR